MFLSLHTSSIRPPASHWLSSSSLISYQWLADLWPSWSCHWRGFYSEGLTLYTHHDLASLWLTWQPQNESLRQIFTRSSSARHNMGPPHFILKHASSVTSTSGFVLVIKCDLLGVKLRDGIIFQLQAKPRNTACINIILGLNVTITRHSVFIGATEMSK